MNETPHPTLAAMRKVELVHQRFAFACGHIPPRSEAPVTLELTYEQRSALIDAIHKYGEACFLSGCASPAAQTAASDERARRHDAVLDLLYTETQPGGEVEANRRAERATDAALAVLEESS